MKTIWSKWSCWGFLATAAVGLAGCGGNAALGAKAPAQQPAYGQPGYGSALSGASLPTSIRSPSAGKKASESAAPPATQDVPAAAPSMDASEPAPSAGERPGLGTEWGETRYSHVNNVAFDRATNHPAQVLSLYYNDHEGARAMARYADYREVGSAVVRDYRVGISVSLIDEAGRPLPAFYAGGHTYAIGEAGQRYTIRVTNETGVRIEAVASVDGLDVLDGKDADFGKRGYLVPSWGFVDIDGFRQTNDHVAEFRFGSVRDSYAARTGSDRNVGIIGVALFTPRGAPSFPWTDREIQRRKNADPFPGSYASPPPPRW